MFGEHQLIFSLVLPALICKLRLSALAFLSGAPPLSMADFPPAQQSYAEWLRWWQRENVAVWETGAKAGLSSGKDGEDRQQTLEPFCLKFWGEGFSRRSMKSNKMSFPGRKKKKRCHAMPRLLTGLCKLDKPSGSTPPGSCQLKSHKLSVCYKILHCSQELIQSLPLQLCSALQQTQPLNKQSRVDGILGDIRHGETRRRKTDWQNLMDFICPKGKQWLLNSILIGQYSCVRTLCTFTITGKHVGSWYNRLI